ncbi:MAG: LLM class flavin-dependent oxidoreductase [Chloroflexota bacterium]|nr:LLM class flavin-dependent oxidoreductase [Dehalococcoidia bacterium]MDW8253884.1 LLM class flavin-dependent oxidoreductase [Chloroflexota bacterium]
MTAVDFEIDAAGTLPVEAIPRLARRAEEAGFAGIWKGETNNRDPVALLAACATATSSPLLGSAILHLLARSPVAAGMAAATLNELSGGRFVLGLGVANPTLARWHGVRFQRPLAMARDYVAIVRQVYAGERVTWAGEAFSAHDFRLAGARPRFPLRIVLAALGPRMSRLAGEIADGVLINMGVPSAVREIAGWAREGALAAGKDPATLDIVVKFRVVLTDNQAAGRDALRPTVAAYCRAPGYRELLARSGFAADLERIEAAWRSGGFSAAIRAVDDAMLERVPAAVVADPAAVRPLLDDYLDAGATRLLLPLIPVSDDPAAETERFLAGWQRGEAQGDQRETTPPA